MSTIPNYVNQKKLHEDVSTDEETQDDVKRTREDVYTDEETQDDVKITRDDVSTDEVVSISRDMIAYMTRFLPFETLVKYCQSSLRFNEICKQNNISAMRLLVEKLLKKPNTMLLLNPSEKKYKFVNIRPFRDLISIYNVKPSLFDGYDYVYFSSFENLVGGGRLKEDLSITTDLPLSTSSIQSGVQIMIDNEDENMPLVTNMATDMDIYKYMATKYAKFNQIDDDDKDRLISTVQDALKNVEKNNWLFTFAGGDPFRLVHGDYVDEKLEAFRHYIVDNFNEVYEYYNLNFIIV